MKIRNGTRYDTREVRRVVTAAYREAARREGPCRRWSQVVVKVRPGRSSWGFVHGRASLGGWWATLWLPARAVRTVALFDTAWHEVMHLYGHEHGAFPRVPDDETRARGLRGLPEVLRWREPKRATPVDRPALRHQRAVAALARWEQKRRRAERAIRRLRARVRYYERKAAATRPDLDTTT